MVVDTNTAGRPYNRATGRFVRTQGVGLGDARFPGESPPAVNGDGQVDIDGVLPPRLYDAVPEVMRGYIRLIAGILLNSDLAYRKDRKLQRQMRHDPDVMGPLLQRQMAVALLDWDIVPQDEDDAEQVKWAEETKRDIEGMVKVRDFFRQLLEADWFGMSAVNILYERKKVDGKSRVVPGKWLPFHPDSILFTETGQLALRVGARYRGSIIPAWDGLAHLLDDLERRAVVLHTFMPQGPDYEEFDEARYAWSGRGLRDHVWYFWLMKQRALQLWMTRIERYSLGIRLGYYPSGNTAGRNAMAKVLRNLVGDVSALVPRDIDGKDGQYGMEILDPPGGAAGAKIHADLIEGYLAGQIKELLIGQSATTEATTEGLGTGVSTRHAETFFRIIKWSAQNLADTITQELLTPLYAMNYGPDAPVGRFQHNIEEVDSEKWAEGAEKFIQNGGVVSQRQWRSRMGLEEPTDDEDKLEGPPQDDLFGGMEDNGTGFGDTRRALGAGPKKNGAN